MMSYWQQNESFGIAVNNGMMTLNGKELYTAGTNCYDLFSRCLDSYDVSTAYKTLDVLKSNGISVVRFNCGDYSYDRIQKYYTNKSRFIELLIKIARYAESKEIGLIPDFFWLYSAVPDFFDEPLNSWGKNDSKTVGFLKEYTESVVSALKNFKSVFAWEFGNEFNLSCDLPNYEDHLPDLPQGSMRKSRTSDDRLSATDVSFAFGKFSETVKSEDTYGRMTVSGNASLRPSQYHQLNLNSWEQDTKDEYKQMTKLFTNGMDSVCEHIYFTEQRTFGRDLILPEYLTELISVCNDLKKPLFIGEWGGGDSLDKSCYSYIGNCFVDAGVQLSLLWNFNYTENSVEYSFSANSERGKMLFDVIKEMNRRYEKEYNKYRL